MGLLPGMSEAMRLIYDPISKIAHTSPIHKIQHGWLGRPTLVDVLHNHKYEWLQASN